MTPPAGERVVDRTFELDEARSLVPHLRAVAGELIPLRAELAEGAARMRAGGAADLPELKSLEARLSELLDDLTSGGIQVKGYAPLLVDLPHVRGDRRLLLCWLEGETELGWYHDEAHGFMGRRPITELQERTGD
ncbi:MAG: DUF2203 domain-containing protein [Actinobacteria bacterium]|nr:DUF2203 domain-containing protein [Actinomycetota bacterium]